MKRMEFKVIFSEEAGQDLEDIFRYIADTLLEPITARKKTERLEKSAYSLDFMPLRYKVYDREPWKSQGYRVFSVEKYNILYYPDESKKTVTIIRIIHGSVFDQKLSVKN